MTDRGMALFAMNSGRPFGERVAQKLGIELAHHEERDFHWGQHKTRALESVRGRDVYVVQSLHGDAEQSANDKLCRLLFFLGALADASAARVTAVVPWMPYTRKEIKTKPRDPVTTRYVARLFEAVETDRVATLEVHSLAAFQNSFRCRTEHLEAHELFAEYLSEGWADHDLVIASPDVGGIKRAVRYRRALEQRLGRELPDAFVEKRRSEDVVSGGMLMGEVKGRTVILVDDMICGGTTIALAAESCHRAGAKNVIAIAAHGAFEASASRRLAEAPIEKIIVLDHIPPLALEPALVTSKLEIREGAGLVAEAIRRMHTDQSLSALFGR